ncbi:hypothetical protein QG37_05806 [Candidozyma auris]|uniref:Uncharacterized protein n=1 Tax=Candidozyma auris TaxID=498019 RepID=A0A0L0NTP8_CANAR|nr:hypothetical protein QG37_05806 [[Candida] auris]
MDLTWDAKTKEKAKDNKESKLKIKVIKKTAPIES